MVSVFCVVVDVVDGVVGVGVGVGCVAVAVAVAVPVPLLSSLFLLVYL